uniref:Minor capsid protein L2 n=1 Tax=Human papillomavirus TaxID=10566 RepID=A0A385PNZ6_9PAPI|nr:MAG: L2 protein [Human papillomavirus]
MTSARKRTKRDSIPNLYNQCKITGNCPEDVQNKVEGTTLADKLLKIFGSILYFGGLGIGTGRGTGGSFGYRPITPAKPGIGGSVIKPTIPLDPIGGVDIIPDIVDANAPAIIPLGENGVIDPALVDNGAGINIDQPEIVTETTFIEEPPIQTGHPTVVTSGDDTVAILDVTPAAKTPARIAIDTSVHAISPNIIFTPLEPEINIFVDTTFDGETIGTTSGIFEDIELQPLNTREEFEIEEVGPKTSTPTERLQRVISRARHLYNRYTQQTATRNPAFIGQPTRLVEFGFENPAFDPDVTFEFENDVAELAAAPDPDFADIIKLGRPYLSETAEGTVRLSRLAQKGSIKTRSGTIIGPKVHYYYDFSTIEEIPYQSIELPTVGEISGEEIFVNDIAETSFVDAVESADAAFTNEDFIDEYSENFNNTHLIIRGGGLREEMQDIPTLPPGVALRVFVDDYGSGIIVAYPESFRPSKIPSSSIIPASLRPIILVDGYGIDYELDPSLLRRKRKRSNSFDFFTDGFMATKSRKAVPTACKTCG